MFVPKFNNKHSVTFQCCFHVELLPHCEVDVEIHSSLDPLESRMCNLSGFIRLVTRNLTSCLHTLVTFKARLVIIYELIVTTLGGRQSSRRITIGDCKSFRKLPSHSWTTATLFLPKLHCSPLIPTWRWL